MVDDIIRSDSPVFNVDDDQDDFTLNLSEQLALMDSDVLMDDVVVIENSDNELENSVDSTMNAMSMILTFPMLSLSDTPQSNSYITETSNLVDDLKSPPSVISAMKPARETKAKFGRRGRPPKVPCRTNSQSKMPLRSCRYNTTNPKTTVKSRKTEGYTCKLNGTWYQITSRDWNVIEAIEHSLQEICDKMSKSSYLNARTLSLDLHHVETAFGILNDDRLDLGMTQEAWQEMLLLAKNNFLEVQLKVENFKKKMFGIESETTHRKLRERKEKQEKSLSNNGSNIRTSALPKQPTAQDASIDTQATNRYFDDIQQDQAMTTEAEVTEEIDLSQRNRNSICRQSQVLDSTRSKLMGLVNSTKGMRTELDSSYIDIVQLNSSQGLESQLTSTQVINSGDFVCEARFSSSSSASCEVPYQDSQVAISRDNPQNVQEELVLVESHNATNAPSKSASKGREKQLKKPFKSDIQQANHGSEIQLTWAVRERVSKYLALARRSFDFSSLVKTRRLVPGKTLTICINSQRYTALLQLDGTLETDADIRFPGLAQWIKSIMGRPFTRLTVKEQRSIQILYEDVPVEEILDRDGFEWDRESYEALGVTIDHQNSPKDTQRETLNSVDKPHETLPNSDKEILHLVPDEMNRNVKSLIVHTKAEYFPTCCCYEKSWEGKEPFPQHYLDELENW